MRFPAKKNAGSSSPKGPRDFPTRKDGTFHPPHPRRVVMSWDSPPSPRVYTGVRTYADVTTKFSRIDRLPNCLPMVLR